MQLQELKKLVEYKAVGRLLVTRYCGGWTLSAQKKDDTAETVTRSNTLETARGGFREFKTLDAVASLVRNELSDHKFIVF